MFLIQIEAVIYISYFESNIRETPILIPFITTLIILASATSYEETLLSYVVIFCEVFFTIDLFMIIQHTGNMDSFGSLSIFTYQPLLLASPQDGSQCLSIAEES